MNTRNAKYNEFGTIDCEIEHPKFGWIPFTASSDDPDDGGRKIHADLMLGTILPYTPKVPTQAETQAKLEFTKQQRIEFIKNKKLEQLLATQITAINNATNETEILTIDI